MKALKCKTLGTALAHAYIVHTHCIGLSAFYLDDRLQYMYQLITLVGNDCQLSLPCGNFND